MTEFLISEKEAKEKILATAGKIDEAGEIFSVAFFKKDDSIRKMRCRLKVKKHLVHGGKRKPTTAHLEEYIVVYEMKGEAKPIYRNVSIKRLIHLKISGEIFTVVHGW